MPGFPICLIILDIWQDFDYTSGIKYVRVLNMLRYSYDNIIVIVTNVVILEFFSAPFVHPGILQLTISYFFKHELKHRSNETFNKLFFLNAMTSSFQNI